MRPVAPHWSHEVLSNWFRSRPETVELDLLREFFPSDEPWTGLDLELFEKHFLLYRRLYQFDDELRMTSGDRLWIRSIRITLVKAPEHGLCRHFDETEGTFCGSWAIESGNRCTNHLEAKGNDLEPSGLKGYYMDWRNLETMSQDRLESMVDAFYKRVFSPDRWSASLELFALPADFTEDQLKRRWRALSHDFHPDHGGDVRRYQELVEGYRFLKETLR